MEIKLNHNIEFILNLLKEEGQGYIVGGFVRDIFLGLNPKDCIEMRDDMEIKLNHNIEFILNLLKEEGQGYIVGGFVRDIFLGLNPKDCDFVTDIEYERLKEIFKKFKPKEMGKHFGIIQIKIDGIPYEIAKMREDIGIPLDRKVQKVEFTKNIYDDLKRRDFTINAIAYDGEKFYFGEKSKEDIENIDRKVQKVEFTKNIYDDLKRRDFTINAIAYDGEKFYFGEKSKEDIENKILRFVGDCTQRIKEDPLRILRYFRFLATKDLKYFPETIDEIKKSKNLIQNLSGDCTQRIKEDPLRILRYFRFLATKDLKYFPETIDEIKKSKNLIQNLSAERIRNESSKIITGKNAYKVLKLMSENKILEEIIPEWSETIGFDQKNVHHIYTVDDHILKSLELTSRDLITRLAVLFHDIGKPRCYTFGEDGQGHFYKHEKYSVEIAEKLMLNLKFSKLDTERVCKIIRYHSLYRQNIDEIFVY